MPGVFSLDEIGVINAKIDALIANNSAGVVRETGSTAVRGVHGPHLEDAAFLDLACREELVDLCTSYLEDEVYIHQYKINMKQALEGRAWPWHQDFVYWREFDHIEAPRLLNIAIALGDITMLQGPMCFIPGSHKHGDLINYGSEVDAGWEKAVSADLTYQLDKSVVSRLLDNHGAEFMLAQAGDVIVFDPQLAHCSSNNMSGSDRRLMIITVNAVSNAPRKLSDRPAFLSARSFDPLRAILPAR